jgi:hypothetical protein
MAWPYLHPVPAWQGLSGPIAGFVDGTAGFGLAALLGLALRRLPGAGENLGLLWGPACVGLFLGWQAALVLALGTVILWWPVSSLQRRSSGARTVPAIAWLALLSLVWILTWGWLVGR